MNGWSARAAISNMKLGLIPLLAFGLGCGFAAGAGGNDDIEAVAIKAGLALSVMAAAVIGWLRPRGFAGAAVGTALILLAVMLVFRTTKWPFTEAAEFGGLVALGELLGVASGAVARRARRRAQS